VGQDTHDQVAPPLASVPVGRCCVDLRARPLGLVGDADNQVLSDFSYNTNTDLSTGESITRSFSGINSVGGPASLTLGGPDGQHNYGKVFTFTGAGEQVVDNPFVGSSPQDGPSFPIGKLWDDESFDVTPIVPAGQQTFTFNNVHTEDCIDVGAAVLQVAQATG
jgi:hypothetical protein